MSGEALAPPRTPFEEAGFAACLLKLGGAQGLAAFEKPRLAPEHLLKEGQRIIVVLPLQGGIAFLKHFPQIPRDFTEAFL